MEEPSAGEREGRAPRKREPSAGEREGPAPRTKEPFGPDVTPQRMLTHWLDGGDVPVQHPLGRINDTWMVAESHVLQRLNHVVFTRPEAVMRNLSRVLAHDDTLLVAPVPTRAGAPFVIDTSGDLWRLFPRRQARDFESLPRSLFAAAAVAYGGFLARFADFPHRLEPVIDGFHDLERYLAALDEAPSGADAERQVVDVLRRTFLPPRRHRVIHGDCKINNLLFHPTHDGVVAIIDLDTVMVGDPAWDFGDLVRSAFAGTEESESPPALSASALAALASGFVSGMGTLDGVARFSAAPAYMSFMLGVRFLVDHLSGDVYFKVSVHGDNLRRARGQLALARRFLDAGPTLTAALDRALRELPSATAPASF